jgi:hypothetical protein
MPAGHRIRFDEPLAGLASATMPVEEYVGLQVLKARETKAQTGKLWAYGAGTFFRPAVATGRTAGLVAPGSVYERIEFDVSTSDLYSCEKYGLEAVVTDEEFAAAQQQGQPISNIREFKSNLILRHLLNWTEQRNAALLFDTSTTFASYTSTPTAKWDTDDADPWNDRLTAYESIKGHGYWNRSTCEFVCLMGDEVWQRTRRNPALLAAVNDQIMTTTNKITPELFAQYLEVDKVLIGSGTYNSSQDDGSETVANIWGDYAGFYMVPKNVQNHVGGILGLSLFYTGVGGALPYGYMNERYLERAADGEVVKGRHYHDPVVKDAGCGFVFSDMTQ